MTVRILFSANERHFAEWADDLTGACRAVGVAPEFDFHCGDDPKRADHAYVIYSPDGLLNDFSKFTDLKAVLSLWAGVERLVTNPTITVPISRMVDPGMIEQMTEWVVGQVLRHHLHFDRFMAAEPGEWLQALGPPPARRRTVAILGLGEMGSSSARALKTLNFRVLGWSRTPKSITGVECHSGPDGLVSAVSPADIVVLLLPHTRETENICDRHLLQHFKPGAVLINSGRGALINDDDLLAAIGEGKLSNATLDVFREEPLPATHPFWTHPRVSVWPHIASETQVDTASKVIAENIRRGENGMPFLNLVDRKQGY